MRWTRVFLAVVSVVFFSGCSGEADSGGEAMPRADDLGTTCWSVPEVNGTTVPGGPADPRGAAVAALANRLEEEEGSSRYATSTCITLPDGGGDHQISVSEGVADFDRGNFRVRAKVVRPGDLATFCREYLILGDRYWGRGGDCPDEAWENDPWQGPSMLTAGELAEFMPSLPGLINGRYEFEEDPYRPPLTVRRQILDALIARMEPAGTEELRGVPTWRYRLTLDDEHAMEVLPDDIVAELAWGQYERPDYEILDVWLDAEGRARRIVGQAGLFDQPARTGYELWDPGAAPPVQVPSDLPGQ